MSRAFLSKEKFIPNSFFVIRFLNQLEKPCPDLVRKLGSLRFMIRCGVAIPAQMLKIQEHYHEHGYWLVYVAAA